MIAVGSQPLHHRLDVSLHCATVAVQPNAPNAGGFSDIQPAVTDLQPQRPVQSCKQCFTRIGMAVAVAIAAQQQDVAHAGSTDQQVSSRCKPQKAGARHLTGVQFQGEALRHLIALAHGGIIGGRALDAEQGIEQDRQAVDAYLATGEQCGD